MIIFRIIEAYFAMMGICAYMATISMCLNKSLDGLVLVIVKIIITPLESLCTFIASKNEEFGDRMNKINEKN